MKKVDWNTDEFLAAFNEMKEVLTIVRDDPDDYIKHHSVAAAWLARVNDVLDDIETGSGPA